MAPGRKHASFRLRSQSDNGVIIELTPLSVCGCISLRLTLSGAALTSFPVQRLLCSSWAAREGLRAPLGLQGMPAAALMFVPVQASWRLVMSVAFLVWEVSLASGWLPWGLILMDTIVHQTPSVSLAVPP